VAKAENLTELQ